MGKELLSILGRQGGCRSPLLIPVMVSVFVAESYSLVAMMAAVFALGLDKNLLCVIGIVITSFGAIISKNWRETLESYDRINYSKFNVLEAMEMYLPAAMFRAEYKDTKNSMMRRSVPSYSARERKIPQLFMVLYYIVGISMAALLALNLLGIIQF